MKYYLFVLASLFSLPSLSYELEGFGIDLGLWSGHRSYVKEEIGDDCFNETHNLIGVTYNGYSFGRYKNTVCEESFYLGKEYGLHKSKYGELKAGLALATGYVKYNHERILAFPHLSYTVPVSTYLSTRFMYIPKSLVGVSFHVPLNLEF
jgi:hypothetical protein